MKRTTTFAIVFVAFIALAAHAEEPQQPVHYFALTDENLASYEAATANLEKVAEKLRTALPPENEENDGSPDALIAALTKTCEKTAPFRTAVEGAKVSCRDFTLMNVTLMQAGILALGYEKRGAEFLERVPGGTTGHVRANIEFVIKRKERLDALTAKQRQIFSE